MKKFLGVVAAIMLVAICAVSVMAQGITVKLNDEAIDFTPYGVEPQIINSRTMVPLRSIFEALKATVEWDDATKTVTSVRGDVTVKVTIGANALLKNGESVALDSPAVIVDSRTLVPVRAISESFGCEVGWDDATKTVAIKDAASAPEAAKIIESIPTQTFDDGNAMGFSTLNDRQVLTFEEDPDDASNKVAKVEAVAQMKFWSYMWHRNFRFQAGQTYKIAFDIKPLGDAAGGEHSTYRAGICFRYAEEDFPILPGAMGQVPHGQWTHIELEYTVPADYEYLEGDDRFGIYVDPAGDLGVSFLVDNLSLEVVEY